MARAIDGELLELEIAYIANKLAKSDAQKALMGRVMYCVEHMPTLTPPNEPLTLDELREMDGEPVWCADGEEHSCYCLVNAESEDCIDSESGAWCFAFYGMTRDGENGLHNMGWLAYRSKPKEAQS